MKPTPFYFFVWGMAGAVAGMLLAGPVYTLLHDHFGFFHYHPVLVMDPPPAIQIPPPVAPVVASATKGH